MKYKIGDKVRIRKDLKINVEYDGVNVIKEMTSWIGEEVTISDIFTEDLVYGIEEDDGRFFWTNSMFEESVTNADRILAMLDEKLAKFLNKIKLRAASSDVWMLWLTNNEWE